MSYRAFKRLLGETSLERKCRFLFGAGILILITASFWLYAYQTEGLAYEQTTATNRVLVNQIFDQYHTPFVINWQSDQLEKKLQTLGKSKSEIEQAVSDNRELWNKVLKAREESDKQVAEKLGFYRYKVLRPSDLEDPFERELFKEFTRADDPKDEATKPRPNELHYYGVIRAQKKCLECHDTLSKKLAANDVTVVEIRMFDQHHRGRRPPQSRRAHGHRARSPPCSSWAAATSSSATSSSSRSST